jgi:hypothetical protein
MSEGFVQLVLAVVLWPAFPSHLLVHVVHGGIK